MADPAPQVVSRPPRTPAGTPAGNPAGAPADTPTVTAVPAADDDACLAASAATAPNGSGPESVGPYRILGELGRGGMGLVYLAQRDDPDLPQKVALKVSAGRLGERSLERFRHERRVLARLSHPNIARLLDGGTSADGTLFLAMELVVGETLLASCDRRRLQVRERVRLFLDVCRAVDFAHRSLIVHRDVKPSNILVSENGEVKLLDFGVAKLLDDDTEGLTREGRPVLTLEYAAPEQIAGQPPTTGFDIFALGVVLFELVAGRRPWPGGADRWRRPETAALRLRQITRDEEAGVGAAGDRGVATGQWTRELDPDLEAIVDCALSIDPLRRYASAGKMAEDLERWMDGRPIEARTPSALYRTRKFAARHRWSLAAAGAVVLAIGVGSAVAGTQWLRARREAARASAVSNFLVDLLAGADPEKTGGADVRVRDVLAEARARLGDGTAGELAGQPDTRALLHTTLGNVEHALGDYAAARADFDAALALDQTLATPDARRRTNASRAALVQLDLAADDLVSARRRAEGVLRDAEATGQAPSIVDALQGLGQVEARADQPEEAESLFRRALGLAVASGDRELTRHARVALAAVLKESASRGRSVERFREGEELLRAALLELEGPEGATARRSSREASDIRFALGIHLREAARGAEATGELRRATTDREVLLGVGHPDTIAARQALAVTLAELGEVEEALRLFAASIEPQIRLFGPDHSKVALLLNNQGIALHQLGRFREATIDYRRVVDIWVRAYGPQHRWSLTAASNLGALLSETGEWAEAEAVLRRTLAAQEAATGPDSVDLRGVLHSLGLVERWQGRPAEALALHRRARAISEASLGAENSSTLWARLLVAMALRDLGRDVEAERELADVQRLRDKLQERTRAALDVTRAELLLQRPGSDGGVLEEAERLLRQALETRHRLGSSTRLVVEAQLRWAEALRRRGKAREAAREETSALQRFDADPELGPRHPYRAYLLATQPTARVQDRAKR
jgi:tetratricopeptide (TPR) repeat protein